MPEVGELVVVAKADVASLQQAMSNIRRSLGDVSRSTKTTLGDFNALGSIMTGAVAGGALAAVQGITSLTKSFLDFTKASPEMQVATVMFNEELRKLAYDYGPIAAQILNNITGFISNLRQSGGVNIPLMIGVGFKNLMEANAPGTTGEPGISQEVSDFWGELGTKPFSDISSFAEGVTGDPNNMISTFFNNLTKGFQSLFDQLVPDKVIDV